MSKPAHTPWVAVALVPAVWMLQGALAWFVAARACPSNTQPLSLATARGIIAAISAAAIAVSLGALASATRALRAQRGAPPASGDAAAAEAREERRFVAMLALVAAVALTLGLIFSALPALVIHRCGEAR